MTETRKKREGGGEEKWPKKKKLNSEEMSTCYLQLNPRNAHQPNFEKFPRDQHDTLSRQDDAS